MRVMTKKVEECTISITKWPGSRSSGVYASSPANMDGVSCKDSCKDLSCADNILTAKTVTSSCDGFKNAGSTSSPYDNKNMLSAPQSLLGLAFFPSLLRCFLTTKDYIYTTFVLTHTRLKTQRRERSPPSSQRSS